MRWILNIARVVSGAGALASAYGYVASFLKEETAKIGTLVVSDHFLEVGYAFGFAAGSLMLIGLFWEWLFGWKSIASIVSSKTKIFGELHDTITHRRDELISVIEELPKSKVSLQYISLLWELQMSLQELSIDCPANIPKVPDDLENFERDKKALSEWATFLMQIAAMAKIQDLKGARAIKRKS